MCKGEKVWIVAKNYKNQNSIDWLTNQMDDSMEAGVNFQGTDIENKQ